jgi:hypothetical protein
VAGRYPRIGEGRAHSALVSDQVAFKNKPWRSHDRQGLSNLPETEDQMSK